MPIIEVSEEELSAIQHLRSEKLNKIAEEKFQLKAIATANRFAKWSSELPSDTRSVITGLR